MAKALKVTLVPVALGLAGDTEVNVNPETGTTTLLTVIVLAADTAVAPKLL